SALTATPGATPALAAATDLPTTRLTINGCNLQNISGVLFNGLVCAEIVSVSPNAITVKIPTSTGTILGSPFPNMAGMAPNSTAVTVSVVDFCGRVSNALQLQLSGCPTTG